ncbi:hypothetical protein LA080_011614 [Diaporthe eres]|nr:hypothetical protein LA080_011614 [Diaporthe eres]
MGPRGLKRSVLNKRLTASMDLTAAHYSRATADGLRGGPVDSTVVSRVSEAAEWPLEVEAGPNAIDTMLPILPGNRHTGVDYGP